MLVKIPEEGQRPFPSKETFKELLQDSTMRIVFEKKDGTIRHMLCTLAPIFLPETYEKKTDRVKKENPDVLSVWDIENNAWRSIRLNSIKKYNVENKVERSFEA